MKEANRDLQGAIDYLAVNSDQIHVLAATGGKIATEQHRIAESTEKLDKTADQIGREIHQLMLSASDNWEIERILRAIMCQMFWGLIFIIIPLVIIAIKL